MKDISIIIVSYNTKDVLQACLLSLHAKISKKITYEIIVVDNASQDGSVDMVKKEFSSVCVIENKENYGFAKANNIGIKKAQGNYILFLNSDTVMKENTLEYLFDYMENHESVGASTCKVELLNGMLDDAAHRGFPTPWNAFSHFSGLERLFPHLVFFAGYTQGYKDMTKAHEIDACAGAFMFVRRRAGEQIDWWDEDYFFYGEDLDFCYKLKQNGWKIMYVPYVSLLHYKGISGGIKQHSQHMTTASKETKKLVTKARFNAMRIFYQKHYEKKYPSWVTWLIYKGIAVKEWSIQ